MLHELHISGLGVIDDLDLELHPRLTVLTGETGAGKTMVTSGLSLALGGKASGQQVRTGSAAARIQARFDAIEGEEGWSDDGELVLARTVRADAKGGARIGGQIATVRALADLGARVAEVHGQHQSLRLLEPSTQTSFLDRYAGNPHLAAVERCRTEATRLRVARTGLEALLEDARDRARELDLLAYQVHEIEDVAPAPGETATLEAEAARLGHVERLQEIAGAVDEALAGDAGAVDRVAGTAQDLQAALSLDPAAEGLSQRADGLAVEVAELARDVRAYGEVLAADPERLQQIRERIAALRGLHRKYGADDVEVLAYLTQARSRLDGLTGAEDREAELREEVAAATTALGAAAAEVTAGRARAAPRLQAALGVELTALGMPQASLEVVLAATTDIGSTGAETAELRFAGGPEEPSLALAKGASGGELSRVMLACRSVLADLDDVPTLVFDEIDAGIGGQAGLAVGGRLARLATSRQVIVVTHLPQIACFADRHVRVRKEDGRATIEVLDEAARVVELSRMLAGLEDSEHARSHAEELLAEARGTMQDAEAAT
ncbi:MAG: DNA repair protein RecN [Actinomycetota bacterium]